VLKLAPTSLTAAKKSLVVPGTPVVYGCKGQEKLTPQHLQGPSCLWLQSLLQVHE
jgi:hypothetical protein